MGQHYDDFFESGQKTTDKGKFMKLPRFHKNLRYNFDGLFNYSTKAAHLDLPARVIVKLGKWSPTNTTHHNYARRLLGDHYGFQELNRINILMDVVRLINKALSDADIQNVLGCDAKIIKYAELGQLLPRRTITASYLTRTNPINGSGQPYLSTTVSTSTLTPTASSRMVS